MMVEAGESRQGRIGGNDENQHVRVGDDGENKQKQMVMVEVGGSKQVRTSDDGKVGGNSQLGTSGDSGSRQEQAAIAKLGGNKTSMVKVMMKQTTKQTQTK